MSNTDNNEQLTDFIPATKKQLFALFCLYKKDHRNMGLSMQKASDLIKNAPKQVKRSKSSLSEYMHTEESINKLKKALIDET